jgi:hypothetical protein
LPGKNVRRSISPPAIHLHGTVLKIWDKFIFINFRLFLNNVDVSLFWTVL